MQLLRGGTVAPAGATEKARGQWRREMPARVVAQPGEEGLRALGGVVGWREVMPAQVGEPKGGARVSSGGLPPLLTRSAALPRAGLAL